MAMLDKQLEFSDAQAVTATAASTNVINCGAAKSLGASGTPVYVEVRVNTACTASGSATIDIALQGSNTEGSGYAAILEVPQIAVADAVAGLVVMRMPLPAQVTEYKFLRIYYTIGTGPLTAGKFDAFLTTAPNVVL